MFNRDDFTCQYCGRTPREDGVKLQVDHIIPVSRGGSNSIWNLITSCSDCNIGKLNLYAPAKFIPKTCGTCLNVAGEFDYDHDNYTQSYLCGIGGGVVSFFDGDEFNPKNDRVCSCYEQAKEVELCRVSEW